MKKKIVKISTPFPHTQFTRQSPLNNGIWGEYLFVENQPVDECDYWAVYEGVSKEEQCKCDPENIYFISGEPPEHKTYSTAYLKQFSCVITCHTVKHGNVISSQQALPWHVGYNHVTRDFNLGYDDLVDDLHVPKLNKISVITSAQTRLTGHRERLQIIDILKDEFGDQIDLFGRGVNPVDDKWDALAPYKYHLAFENSQVDHYWTEKLVDPFLAECFPIYWGAPNISSYFSDKSMLDIGDYTVDQIVSCLHRMLDDSQHYDNSVAYIRASKQRVLNEYNLLPFLIDIFDKKSVRGDKEVICVRPQSSYRRDEVLNKYLIPAKRVLRKKGL